MRSKIQNSLKNGILKTKNSRVGTCYSRIDNSLRLKLISSILEKRFFLKDIALKLNIKYSTAKTILRTYRLENRILKKTYTNNKNNQNANQIENKSKVNVFNHLKLKIENSTPSILGLIDTLEITQMSEILMKLSQLKFDLNLACERLTQNYYDVMKLQLIFNMTEYNI